MREIQLKDAKAKLSAVVDEAVAGEPSIITRHGKPAAVVIGIEEWNRRVKPKRSFGWYLTNAPIEDGDLPERDRTPVREPDFE